MSATASPPNAIVVALDTLRADRLAAYGNTDGLMPDVEVYKRVLSTLASVRDSAIHSRRDAQALLGIPRTARPNCLQLTPGG